MLHVAISLADSSGDGTLSRRNAAPLVAHLRLVYQQLGIAFNNVRALGINIPIQAQRDAFHARFAVGQRINHLAAVSRLPNELISKIFGLFASGEVPSRGGVRCWAKIINVCRHWRQVGLADPRLWSTLDYQRPRLAELWRARSGGVPLSVEFPHSGVPTPLKLAVLKELPRTSQLNITCESSDEQRVIRDALRAPAPLLKDFTIHGAGPLPDDTFAHHAPHLRVLFVMRTAIPWRSQGFTNLTDVALYHRCNFEHSWENIFGFIAGSPRMTTLVLDHYLGQADGGPPAGVVLPMKYLRHMEIIEQHLEVVDTVLSVVKLRPDIDLLISADDMFEGEFFPHALAAHCRAVTRDHAWRGAYITEGDGQEASANSLTFHARSAAWRDRRVPQLVLRGDGDVTISELLARVVSLSGQQCLQHIEELAFGTSDSGISWQEIFARAPRLCEIDARSATVGHELAVYLQHCTTPQTRTALSMLRWEFVDGTERLADGRRLADVWMNLVTTWHRMKAPLSRLTLAKCTGFDVARLQRVIREVVVQ